METSQEQSIVKNKFIVYVKFLISLVLLTSAFSKPHSFFIASSSEQIRIFVWRFIALIWGSLWFVQLPSIRVLPSVRRILDNSSFKKTIKWLLVILVLVLIGLPVVSLFDGFIPGLSGKDFFTIMLAPILH